MTVRSEVPQEFVEKDVPTEKQANFIRNLLNERVMPGKDHRTGEERRLDALRKLSEGSITKRQASKAIEWLLTLPKSEVSTNKYTSSVPEGRYALPRPGDALNPIHFYQVQHGKGQWVNWVFLSRFASDDKMLIKGSQRDVILGEIAADPRGAAILYGHEINQCSVCGRGLTREESREAGIGPVCAEKRGW